MWRLTIANTVCMYLIYGINDDVQVNSQTEKFRRQEVTKGPAHETLVMTVSSNKGSGETAQMERSTRAFPARIHKVLKTQTKI